MMQQSTILLLLFALYWGTTSTISYAQNTYEIDIDKPEKEIIRGHLNLGGTNPRGDSLAVNNYYFEFNGKPFFPINGEFHFSRYPSEYWEGAIRKLKAGGINVIATYVFWNMHEPEPGTFNWTGDLNLRRFIELCEKNDVWVILRIGPFAHGAVRNGGLPDWLYGRPFNVRSNDPGYLRYVERLYNQIGSQVEGLMFKDGGPIMSIQLENEYQHSAAQWALTYHDSPPEYTVASHDRSVIMDGVSVSKAENEYAAYGKDHMKTLKQLAIEAGMKAPFYTATGWGNASIIEKESIPVTAAYPYPTWASVKPSPFYLYKDIHLNPDYSPVSYQPELYPSFSAEIGAGVMENYNRRPFIPQKSMAPLIIRTIGSGSNGIGYYVYHGGSTPYMNGKFYSDITLPKISHEHQSPIGEFGELLSSYYDLKLIHYFLNSYGDKLAPTTTYLPETNKSIVPKDVGTLRYTVRAKDNSGFIFMHNFQDHVALKDLRDLQLTVVTGEEKIQIPENGTFDLKKEAWAVLPFNMNLEGTRIRYATVQPLTRLTAENTNRYVFYSIDGLSPEFAIDSDSFQDIDTFNSSTSAEGGITYVKGENDEIFSFTLTKNGERSEYFIVPEDMALNAWMVRQEGREELMFSPATILEKSNTLELISHGLHNVPLYVYGSPGHIHIKGADVSSVDVPHPDLTGYEINFKQIDPPVELKQVTNRHWILNLDTENLSSLNDIYLEIDYEGDMVQAFIGGQMVADDLYLGKPWIVGLKRFFRELSKQNMYFYFHPLYPGAPFYQDFSDERIPDFSDKKKHLEIKHIEITPEYKAYVTIL